MAETPEPVFYCLACGSENTLAARFCHKCGRELSITPRQQQQGAAFLLNELEALREEGEIGEDLYLRLRSLYRQTLEDSAERPEPAPTPAAAAPPRAPPPRPAVPKREGPGWLAEQQANLLLYLGAFLITIATLIFVSREEQGISDGFRMALLVLGTLLFLAAGLICLRFPRVREAGVVFFVVGALMVPLNFVGAYAFFYADEDIDATGLWLAGSLTSALFYGAVSMLRLGRWYPVPLVVALHSALAALLVLADASIEAYPGSYIALALLLTAPSLLPLGRVSEVFSLIGSLAAHAVVPLAVITALSLTAFTYGDDYGPFLEITTRWYLPPTALIAMLFYWSQSLWARRDYPDIEPFLTFTALAVTGGAAMTLVYALDVGYQWYGPAIAIIGFLYAGGSERFGPRWFGQRHLAWMALGAITVSWLFFEGIYADFPRHGAGVHFAATAFYLAAARRVKMEVDLLPFDAAAGQRPSRQQEPLHVPVAVGFIYAAGLTLGIGFYHLLSSLPAAETAEVSDLSMAFFGLSLAVAAVAATMRWWWPEVRLHTYVIALGMSLFVLLASAEVEGQVALLLVVYMGVALALTLWEREPLALALPAAYGFFALLAAWRYYEPTDAYLPLVFTAVGYGLFLAYVAMRQRRDLAELLDPWARVALGLAFVYAAAAPIVGWVRLSVLADPEGFVGVDSFEETWLYQTSAASLLLLGLLVLAQSWLARRVEFAAGASALLMVALLLEIGHFRPENVQAYTAPLGVYLFIGAVLASRARELPEELQSLIGPMQALGAAVLMGPSLVQSWEEGGWPYALVLLGEGLAFIGFALVQRSLWLLSTATGFIVLDALRFLFDEAQALPDWLAVALAGLLLLLAGMTILLGREQWTRWQREVQIWWRGEPSPTK